MEMNLLHSVEIWCAGFGFMLLLYEGFCSFSYTYIEMKPNLLLSLFLGVRVV